MFLEPFQFYVALLVEEDPREPLKLGQTSVKTGRPEERPWFHKYVLVGFPPVMGSSPNPKV